VLGLEEVTSYFHCGLAESVASNEVNRAGIPTSMVLSPSEPLVVNTIMGVVSIPNGFDNVKSIKAGEGDILLESTSGKSVSSEIDIPFLYGKETF
jgi:hypothetical protein